MADAPHNAGYMAGAHPARLRRLAVPPRRQALAGVRLRAAAQLEPRRGEPLSPPRHERGPERERLLGGALVAGLEQRLRVAPQGLRAAPRGVRAGEAGRGLRGLARAPI